MKILLAIFIIMSVFLGCQPQEGAKVESKLEVKEAAVPAQALGVRGVPEQVAALEGAVETLKSDIEGADALIDDGKWFFGVRNLSNNHIDYYDKSGNFLGRRE